MTGSIDEIAPANESPADESGDLPDLHDEADEATAYFIFQSDEETPRPLADDGSGAAIAGPAADEPAEPVPPEWPPPAANGHFSPANQFPATDAYANGDTARMQAAAATTAPPGDQTAAAAGLPFQQTLLKRGLGLLDGTGERTKTLLFAVFYLILLTAAELLTVFVFVRVGALLHALTLLMLLAHTVRRMGSPDHRLWAAISLVPLIRIVSLTLPLDDFTLPYWFLFTSIPLFAAGYIIMRLLSMSWDDAGVNLRGLPLQLLISLLGLALGYIEYQILQPEPLIDELTLAQFWLPALIILISTGFLEELLFRGILQGAAVGVLGPALGVVYGALYFGVLHVGYQSLADVLFVTAVGLVFGWIVLKTRSIIGVSLAHGLTNITLFLIMPFMAGGSLALPF